MDLDLESFHISLFGQNSSTPSWAVLNDTHKKLYQGFRGGKHGYTATGAGEENFDQFLAVFVLALHQTSYPSQGEVLVIMAPAVTDWCAKQLRMIVRSMLRTRKQRPRERTQLLIDAIQRLIGVERPLQMKVVPARWVSYGFTNEAHPSWFKGTLLD